MNDTFQPGQILTADDLNSMMTDIDGLKPYQNCIKPGNSSSSLIGGLGINTETPSQANGIGSFTFGKGLITNREGEIAFGSYNNTLDADKNIVFSIGNGKNEFKRSNLFSISSDGEAIVNGNKLATTNDIDSAKTTINTSIKALDDKITNQNTEITSLKTQVGGLNTNLIGFKSKYFYPVGSVYISTINYENPADLSNEEVLGKGAWKLIDKEFTSVADTLTSFGTSNNTEYATINNICYVRAGHAIRLRIYLTLSAKLMQEIAKGNLEQEESTKLTIAHLTLADLGISSFEWALLNIPILSDKGECLFMANIKKDGAMELTDHIAKSVGLETTKDCSCYINLDITCPMTVMDNSACNKFYYERTE